MFLPSDLLHIYLINHSPWNFAALGLHSQLVFLVRVFQGFMTGCPCGVWCCVLNTCLLCVGLGFGQIHLNKVVCKFDRMENSYSLSCHYVLIAMIDILLLKYLRFSYIFTSWIAFKLTSVRLTSIFHWRDLRSCSLPKFTYWNWHCYIHQIMWWSKCQHI